MKRKTKAAAIVELPEHLRCPAVEALVSAGDVISLERRGERKRAVVEYALFGVYTGWRYAVRYLDVSVFEIIAQAEIRRRMTLTVEQVERLQRNSALYLNKQTAA